MRPQPFRYRVDTLYKPMGSPTNSLGKLNESSEDFVGRKSQKDKSPEKSPSNTEKGSKAKEPERVRTPLKWPEPGRKQVVKEVEQKVSRKAGKAHQSLENIRRKVKDIFYQVNQGKSLKPFKREAVWKESRITENNSLRSVTPTKLPAIAKARKKTKSYAAEFKFVSLARENPISQSLSLLNKSKISGKNRLENQTIRNGVKELVLKNLDAAALLAEPEIRPNPELANFISMEKKYSREDIEYREAFLFSWMRHYLKAYQNKQEELLQLKEYMEKREQEAEELRGVIKESRKDLLEHMLNLKLVEEGLQFLDYCKGLLKDIEEASRAERGSGLKDEVVGLSGQEPKSLPKYKGKEYRLQNNGMLFARNGIKGKPKREALVAVKSPNKQLNRNIELQEIALESREKKETETAMKPSKYWEELQTPRKIKSQKNETAHGKPDQKFASESKSGGNQDNLISRVAMPKISEVSKRVEESRKEEDWPRTLSHPKIVVNSMSRSDLGDNQRQKPKDLHKNTNPSSSKISEKAKPHSEEFIKIHKHKVKSIAETVIPWLDQDSRPFKPLDSALSPINQVSNQSLQIRGRPQGKKPTVKLSRENSESNVIVEEERSPASFLAPPNQPKQTKKRIEVENSLHSSSEDRPRNSEVGKDENWKDENKEIHQLMIRMISRNEVERREEESEDEIELQSKGQTSKRLIETNPKYRTSLENNAIRRDTNTSQMNENHSSYIFQDDDSREEERPSRQSQKKKSSMYQIRDDSNLNFIDSEDSRSRINS
jgi:hypothetical protein